MVDVKRAVDGIKWAVGEERYMESLIDALRDAELGQSADFLRQNIHKTEHDMEVFWAARVMRDLSALIDDARSDNRASLAERYNLPLGLGCGVGLASDKRSAICSSLKKVLSHSRGYDIDPDNEEAFIHDSLDKRVKTAVESANLCGKYPGYDFMTPTEVATYGFMPSQHNPGFVSTVWVPVVDMDVLESVKEFEGSRGIGPLMKVEVIHPLAFYRLLDRVYAGKSSIRRVSCVWVEDSKAETCWNTGCNHDFMSDIEEPGTDEFDFCPFCGGRIIGIEPQVTTTEAAEDPNDSYIEDELEDVFEGDNEVRVNLTARLSFDKDDFEMAVLEAIRNNDV